MRTRPETKSRLGGDFVLVWDFERGLPTRRKIPRMMEWLLLTGGGE